MTTERLALASADWKRRAVHGFWWIAGRSAIDEALRLLIFLALARQLAPEAFGVVALFGVALAALSLLVEQGLGRSLVQRESPTAAHFDSVFWLQSVLALVVCAAITAGAQPVAALLDLAPHATALQLLVWSLLFQAIRTVPLARLERDFRARSLALSRLAGTLSGGAAALAIAAAGGGLWSLVAQQLLSAAAETAGLCAASRWRPGRQVQADALRELLGFSSGLTGIAALNLARKQTDRLLVGLALGPATLGLYTNALRLVDLVTHVATQPFSQLAFPLFARLRADPPALRAAYCRTVQTTCACAFPLVVGLVALAPDAVPLVLGPAWQPMVPALQALALLAAFQAIYLIDAALILGSGNSLARLRLNAALALLTVLCIVVALPFGITALCFGVVAAAFVFLPFELRYVDRLTGLDARDHWRNVSGPAMAGVIMLVTVVAIQWLLGGDAVTSVSAAARAAGLVGTLVAGFAVYVVALAAVDLTLLRALLALLRGGAKHESTDIAQAKDAMTPDDMHDGAVHAGTPAGRLRVAMFVEGFPVVSETFVIEQAIALLERGHDVHIFSFAARPLDAHRRSPRALAHGLIERTRYAPARVRQLGRFMVAALAAASQLLVARPRALPPLLNVLSYRRHALHLQLLFAGARLLRDGGCYDIVHCQFGHVAHAVLALYDAGLLQGALVSTFRGADISRFVQQRGPQVYTRLFERGDAFFTNCRYFERRLHELGCPPARTRVLYSAVDCARLPFRTRAPLPAETVRLITVGRLVEKKGIAYALRAVALLMQRGWPLEYRIVGEGPLRASLQKLAAELGIQHTVTFSGALGQGATLQAVDASHILLGPSVRATDGDEDAPINSLKEAIALGVPVVATWHGGIPECVQDGVTGYLVPERDAAALARAIERLLRDPTGWAAMARRGRMLIEQRFAATRLHDTLLDVYAAAIARERHKRLSATQEEHDGFRPAALPRNDRSRAA